MKNIQGWYISIKSFFVGILFFTLLIIFSAVVFAHSGGTDASGGHRDNKNRSGLGSYHYHHGRGPHLHPNGVCPLATSKPKLK